MVPATGQSFFSLNALANATGLGVYQVGDGDQVARVLVSQQINERRELCRSGRISVSCFCALEQAAFGQVRQNFSRLRFGDIEPLGRSRCIPKGIRRAAREQQRFKLSDGIDMPSKEIPQLGRD
jgi:hypothetical protein